MAEQLLDTLRQDVTSLLDQARKAGNNVLLEDTKESIKVLFDIENIYKHSLSSGSK
jgi:soluble cytochrome b562